MTTHDPLSRRERQLMDIVYRLDQPAAATELRAEMADAPSYSAVRALLATLVKKGHLSVERVGVRNVYVPTVPAEQASRSAMQRVVDAFFGGSAARAAVALLSDESLDDKTVLELQGLVHAAREEGR